MSELALLLIFSIMKLIVLAFKR